MGAVKNRTRKKKTVKKSGPKSTTAAWSTLYFQPHHPGAFSGAQTFYKHLKAPVHRKQVQHFLQSQDAYTLHFPLRRRFPRRSVIVAGPFAQWQADLCDMTSLQKANSGYRYLLTVIDVFSKVAHVRPLKTKTGRELVQAFEDILQHSERTPKALQTDKGSEFRNTQFQEMLKKHKIHFFTTENEDIKAGIVERFNRTLKGRMYRYFTHNATQRYIDVLQPLVDNYNATYHRSIKTQPRLVGPHNFQQVYHALYDRVHRQDLQPDHKPPRFQVGDRVRLAQAKRTFKKGYLPAWTQELFTIHRRLNRTPPYVYSIRDDNQEVIQGSFYEPELQKVIDTGVFKIEKILRRRGDQILVRWQGYGPQFDSWIARDSLGYKK